MLYTLIRVSIFAAVFAVLYAVVRVEGWVAAVIAAIVGLCVSYIFFRPQRDDAVRSLAPQRDGAAESDEAAED